MCNSMRSLKLECIALLILGIYLSLFLANLRFFSAYDEVAAVENPSLSSLKAVVDPLDTHNNASFKIEKKYQQNVGDDNGSNLIRNKVLSIEESKEKGDDKKGIGIVKVEESNHDSGQNIEVEVVHRIDTSTIIIDGRPAGAIVSTKIIGKGDNQRKVNYVFCEGCRINMVDNIYCGSKYDYKLRKGKLSMEQAIAEVMKNHPTCAVPAVKHVPISNENESSSADLREHQSNLGLEGHWVQDWEYSKRTTYINFEEWVNWGFDAKAPKEIYRWDSSWRWEDSNSLVAETSLNGFCQVCYKLGITRLFLLGDSVTQIFYKGLLSLIGLPPLGKDDFDFLTIGAYGIPCDQSDTPAEFRAVELKYLRVLRMNDIERLYDPSHKVLGLLKVSEYASFIETNPNRTAIVFNTGAHMKDLNEYRNGFHLLLSWLDSLKVRDPSKMIGFFRDTVPGHPECEPHGIKGDNLKKENFNKTIRQLKPYADYDEYRKTTDAMIQKAKQKKSSVEWPWYWYQHANGTIESYNTYSKEIFAKRSNESFPIHWLNTYNSTILRRDGHDGFGDCLHYHVPGPGDWWIHFFYSTLLNMAGLKEENTPLRDKNSS